MQTLSAHLNSRDSLTLIKPITREDSSRQEKLGQTKSVTRIEQIYRLIAWKGWISCRVVCTMKDGAQWIMFFPM